MHLMKELRFNRILDLAINAIFYKTNANFYRVSEVNSLPNSFIIIHEWRK